MESVDGIIDVMTNDVSEGCGYTELSKTELDFTRVYVRL